jgi:hypothetical protein
VERIPVEIHKIGGPALEIRVHNLIKTIWKKEIIAKDWPISMVCPIYNTKGTRHNAAAIVLCHCSAQHTEFSHILEILYGDTNLAS